MADRLGLALALALTGLVAPSPAAAQSAKPVAIYVGTFTDRTSRGIYRFEFDPATGTASTPVLATGGRTPRHFAIDPSGQWLLVAHQDSDSTAVFRLDPQTGLPAPTGVMVAAPEPVCLLFTSR